MRVRNYVFCLGLIVCFYSFAFAQNESLPRYYDGIGIRPWQVGENTKGFGGQRNGVEVWFNNEQGRFTGSIFVGRVLRDGPAARAGLETGDAILQVDKEPVYNIEELVAKITKKEIGEEVELRIRQMDPMGENYYEFSKTVRIETIDNAEWVPYDMSFGGSMSVRDVAFSYRAEVSKTRGGAFIYRYDFTNHGRQSVILRTELVNLLLSKEGEAQVEYFMVLHPGRTTSFTLETEDYPVDGVSGPLSEYVSSVINADLYKYFLENYPDTSSGKYFLDSKGTLWLNDAGTSFYLVVPSSWVVPLTEANERFWKRD